jgi:predicted Fe-Mo cluster-binding NifX family protein
MKIAIPTNDGITINPHFGRSKSFFIARIVNGDIVHEELRENPVRDHNHESHGKILSCLNDCSVVIVNGIGRHMAEKLEASGKEIIHNKEPFMFKVLVNFLNETLRKESNSCCCP